MHQHSRSNCVAVLRLKTEISSGSSSRMERTAILKLAMYSDTEEISRSQSLSTKSRCVTSLTTGPFRSFVHSESNRMRKSPVISNGLEYVAPLSLMLVSRRRVGASPMFRLLLPAPFFAFCCLVFSQFPTGSGVPVLSLVSVFLVMR